jgi:hypothetical protein
VPKRGFVERRPEHPGYRVFLSYSHQDLKLVKAIDAVLKRNGLSPMWDEHFLYGQGFHEQIKNFIAHAHVFLPILTPTASHRNWVHQEVGYAMALNVPVLPVAIGEIPGEMIQHLHAIRIAQSRSDLRRGNLSRSAVRRLEKLLTVETIERLIERSSHPASALFACADFPEARASMIASYCEDVRTLGKSGLVRQKGALSSFHIPLETINHKVWRERYGKTERSDEHCRLQRLERLALTWHAEKSGCKLIIDPFLKYQRYGEPARRVRLECLQRFLRQMPDGKCQVAIRRNMGHGTSNTCVGDWFAAESVLAVIGKGYFQTIFTRHAASLRDKTANFDSEFAELLAENGVKPRASRRQAIRIINQEIRKIGRKPTRNKAVRQENSR